MLTALVAQQKHLTIEQLKANLQELRAKNGISKERVDYNLAVVLTASKQFKSAIELLKSLQNCKDT
jgi:hypothetical protein